MTNTYYKAFKNTISTADEKDPIWWAGFLWIDLTKRQAKDIITILEKIDFIKEVTCSNGKQALEIPSGLAIWKEQ